MKTSYVFDSYAVLELLENGLESDLVAKILENKNQLIFMSYLSLGEIYYILLRRRGEAAAEEVVESIIFEDRINLVEANWGRIRQAAALKANGGLSYADAFMIALGLEKEAVIVNNDPEIYKLAGQVGLEVVEL